MADKFLIECWNQISMEGYLLTLLKYINFVKLEQKKIQNFVRMTSGRVYIGYQHLSRIM